MLENVPVCSEATFASFKRVQVAPLASRAILALSIGLLFLGCRGSIPNQAQGGGGGHGPSDDDGVSDDSSSSLGASQWRRLSGDQYIKIVQEVLGVQVPRSEFLADTLTGRFATNTLPAQETEVDRYASVTEIVADRVDAAALAKCAQANRSCAERIVEEVAPRLYRRKLQAEESEALLKLFDLGNADGFKTGASAMFQSMLQSPSFLYLVEFGKRDDAKGLKRLEPYEVAARLALLLWNTAPDAALLKAAESDALGTAELVKQQAERMMKDQRFGLAVADFHLQLFRVNKLTREGAVRKESLGGFSLELRQAMVDETTNFITNAVQDRQANVETLLTAKHSFPPPPLLAFNKTPAAAVKANGRVEYNDGKRAGLLTMSGFMTAEPPTPTPYGAVQRGKIVREDLLCGHIPPPPPGLVFEEVDPEAPQRVVLQQHQEEPTCKVCHTLMDNIGFAFENYDAFGRYRDKYPRGEAIDSSGFIDGETDVDGSFSGPQQLGEMLARSREVRNCLAGHWFRYGVGREPTEADEPSVAAIAEALREGAGDIPSALLAFVQSDAFRFISGGQ